jgi:hypothetical protein
VQFLLLSQPCDAACCLPACRPRLLCRRVGHGQRAACARQPQAVRVSKGAPTWRPQRPPTCLLPRPNQAWLSRQPISRTAPNPPGQHAGAAPQGRRPAPPQPPGRHCIWPGCTLADGVGGAAAVAQGRQLVCNPGGCMGRGGAEGSPPLGWVSILLGFEPACSRLLPLVRCQKAPHKGSAGLPESSICIIGPNPLPSLRACPRAPHLPLPPFSLRSTCIPTGNAVLCRCPGLLSVCAHCVHAGYARQVVRGRGETRDKEKIAGMTEMAGGNAATCPGGRTGSFPPLRVHAGNNSLPNPRHLCPIHSPAPPPCRILLLVLPLPLALGIPSSSWWLSALA